MRHGAADEFPLFLASYKYDIHRMTELATQVIPFRTPALMRLTLMKAQRHKFRQSARI